MAKRYKNNERKKGKIKYFLFFLAIIIILVAYGIHQKWFVRETKQENNQEISGEKVVEEITEKVEKNRKLTSNLLNPKELNDEIMSILADTYPEGSYITKIHYKLKNLESGNIDIYYKANGKELLKMVVNIDSKEIESTEKYEDEYLLSKGEILNNLTENIEQDFNNRKAEMELGNKVVNIIITNTEVVINTSINN